MLQQKKGLRFLLSVYIIYIAIIMLAAPREGKSQRKTNQKDCININVSNLNKPFSYSEPCVKLWQKINCKGTFMSQEKLEMARSVSDCSLCKRKNRTGGRFCTGSKDDHKCVKASLCNGDLETLETDSEVERRNVPLDIQPVDVRNFKVFNPLNRSNVDEPSVSFIVYRKPDINLGLDAETVEFKNNEKVLIYIHGYANRILEDGTNIKNAVFEGTSDVDAVILVDWRMWSLRFFVDSALEEVNHYHPSNYKIVALANIPIVAEQVRQFLLAHLNMENYIYIVGFSLGAHVAGTAARELAKSGPVVDRISALDPAGPIFEYTLNKVYPLNMRSSLRISDAAFVDVVHCSTVLGMVHPIGHLDTYLKEDSCKLPYCVHRKAIQMFISSLNRCSLITCPKSGEECSPLTVSSYGYLSDVYPGRGIYGFSITTKFLSWNDEKCSEFMNVYLPAKNRVCLESPNDNGDCNGYPYLTECAAQCSNQNNITRSVCSTHANVRMLYKDVSQNQAQNLKFARNADRVKWQGGECTI